MRLIKPLVVVEEDLDMLMPNGETKATHMLKKIEAFTRKCYKSEGKATGDSYKTFLKAISQTKRHTGILEHASVSVTFITDRGVSHESVRHRMASYLQESTRYCDYSADGKHSGVTYILPPWVKPGGIGWDSFLYDLENDDKRYNRYRQLGWPAEQARYWLPVGIKTEYACTMNLGGWWNFLNKRTAPEAHPQIRQLAIPLLRYFNRYFPEFFSNIAVKEAPVPGMFDHKGNFYDEAKLVVNPYYDEVCPEVVDCKGM